MWRHNTWYCTSDRFKLDLRADSTVEISVKSLCLWTSFHPPNPSFGGIRKVKKFYKISVWNAETQYEMLSISCIRFERNHTSCTGRSSENLSSSTGGAQEKKKDRGCSWISPPPWMLMYFFAGFFLISPCMTKLRALVLSFPDFTDIYIRDIYITEYFGLFLSTSLASETLRWKWVYNHVLRAGF